MLLAAMGVIACLVPGCRFFQRSDSSVRWMVYYGQAIPVSEMPALDYIIAESEHLNPKDYPHSKAKWLGYVSVGEAEEYRSYWPDLVLQSQEKKILVAANPDWAKAHSVDIRSAEWQSILFDRVIPALLARGYDGLFLDTVDVAASLEELDPIQYQGASEALVRFVREIRRRYPNILIFPNNGFAYMDASKPHYMDVVDGIVVEDLYTRYQFDQKNAVDTPAGDSSTKERILKTFVGKYRKPVLNILYDNDLDSSLIRRSALKSEQNGFSWYATHVDLQSVGRVRP